MRRMRRFFAALFVLVLFGTGVVCIPAQGAQMRTVATETRDPYRPVEVQSYTWGDFDVIYIMRNYRLSPIGDCSKNLLRNTFPHVIIFYTKLDWGNVYETAV